MRKETLKGFVVGVIAAAVMASVVSYAADAVKIYVDGSQIETKDANGNQVDPIIIDGTTYLPVRAVTNALGKTVGWDEATSSVYIGSYGGNLVNSAIKLVNIENTGAGWGETDVLTDNYGNYYSDALVCFGNYTGMYSLNGAYDRLMGTLYVGEGETRGGTAELVITVDGEDVYKFSDIDNSTSPVHIDISLAGVNTLEITRNGDPFNIYLGNARLYK